MQSFLTATVLLLSLFGQQVSAFSSNPHQPMMTTKTTSTRTTQLFYNIIAPPDDENCEIDSSNCEESVFDIKRRERKQEDAERRELYAKAGIDLTSIDRMTSHDQFDNAAGGGIIPGMQMSALMEDD
mmetsp:Transcript_11867/g.13195  ORF Transcript_11867/g.13195 Transcript_11867/m.13195 type:complete len:127 (+) Transcript_11867:195-575(+)